MLESLYLRSRAQGELVWAWDLGCGSWSGTNIVLESLYSRSSAQGELVWSWDLGWWSWAGSRLTWVQCVLGQVVLESL